MQQKTLYIFLFSFFLFLVSAVIRYHTVAKMRMYTSEVDHSSEITISLARLSNFFKSAQLYSPTYEAKVAQHLYNIYRKEGLSVVIELHKLDSMIADNSQRQKQFDQIAGLIHLHLPELMQKNMDQLIKSNAGGELGDFYKITSTLNMMAEQEEKYLENRKQELNRTIYWNNVISLVLVLIAVVTIASTFIMNLGLNRKRLWLEGFLESILNSSKNGIISFAPVREKGKIKDFNIEYANNAINDLLGIKPQNLIGQKASQFIRYMTQDSMQQYMHVVEKQEPVEYENHFIHNKVNRWLMIRLAPREDGFTATFHDITALKASEQKLKESVQQLERSNKELEQYAYAASHDLQEPLRKIQTFSNYLLERQWEKLDDSGKKYLSKILASSQRMSTLIKDILNFSSVRDGSGFTNTDLNKEMEDVLQDLELMIRQKEAIIQKERLPHLTAIPLQIRQLFYNLVNNALKFTVEGRQPVVRIACRKLEKSEIEKFPELTPEQTYYQVEIRDNGVGFSNAHADNIFSLFKRLNSKDDFEGSGIGLALCLKVVENHHGVIYAKGEEGNGACFYVILPQKQQAPGV